MSADQTYAIAAAGLTMTDPLRNIRIAVDGATAVIDMIPSVVSDQAAPQDDLDPKINRILAGARVIVEDGCMLRAEFEGVAALFLQEEYVDLIDELHGSPSRVPKISNSQAVFPFLRVENSILKARLPDYQGGEDPGLQHYKMVSMETCVDILAHLVSFDWIANPHAATA